MTTSEFYADGSYRNGTATYGVYSKDSNYNTHGRVSGEQSAHNAECEAIRQATIAVKQHANSGQGKSHYTIRSDSKAAVNDVNGRGRSSASSASKAQINSLASKGVSVKVSHVPGHSGHKGNVAAHNNANKGRK